MFMSCFLVCVFFSLQVLGCYAGGLHTFTDQWSCIYDDMHGMDIVYHCVTGTAIRMEGSRVHATNRATKMHGFAGYRISSMSALRETNKKNRKKICYVSVAIFFIFLQVFATCSTFYVPLLVILVLYWKIYQTARKRIHRRRPKQVQSANNNQVSVSIFTN